MTGTEHVKFYEQLRTNRQPAESVWKDCYRYSHPMRGLLFDKVGAAAGNNELLAAGGKSAQADLLDGTAGHGCNILASGLVSGMTPANSQWAGLEVDDNAEVNRFLESASKQVHKNIHASNFDAPAFELALDIAIAGWGVMYVEPGDDAPYRFELWPNAECFCAASKRGGLVDIIYRPYSLMAIQALGEFGEDRLPKRVRDAAIKKPFDSFTFIHAIRPKPAPKKGERRRVRDALLPFESVHVCQDSKQVVREAGYHEFPCAVPRWLNIPGSVYATGPMSVALPDQKTINEVERLTLGHADITIAGMWGAVDDGVLNPKTVKIGARKVVMMASKDSFFPLTPGGSFDVSAILLDQKRASVRQALMADQLEPLAGGPAKTATEVHYRVNLIRQLLGPTYGRLQSEYLKTIFTRCFMISLRAGELGQLPPELQNKRLTMKYISPLARAQQLEDVAAMDAFEQDLLDTAGAGIQTVVDIYDWDAAKRKKARLRGVDQTLILDEDKVTANRQQRAKDQQEEQARQLQLEMLKKGGPDGAGQDAAV